ncbi:Zn-ribbon domain-containing OB-fold protein [Rhodococcus qingshengii]
MDDDLPGSVVDVPTDAAPHSAYIALLGHGVLGFQACSDCCSAVFPPRGRCSRCGADALLWRASAGLGTVYSATVITPRAERPYAVVLVDLDEGYRMMSRVDRGEVAIGDRVVVDVCTKGEEPLPLFISTGVSNA